MTDDKKLLKTAWSSGRILDPRWFRGPGLIPSVALKKKQWFKNIIR